jgi:hypothetical protein
MQGQHWTGKLILISVNDCVNFAVYYVLTSFWYFIFKRASCILCWRGFPVFCSSLIEIYMFNHHFGILCSSKFQVSYIRVSLQYFMFHCDKWIRRLKAFEDSLSSSEGHAFYIQVSFRFSMFKWEWGILCSSKDEIFYV